jgi:uncharacterized membrane protein YeiH
MSNTIYLVITALALLWVMIFSKYLVRMNNTFFIFDAIGLALFAVVCIQKTLDAGFPLWVATIMGTFTGAAGGVLRDVFINEIPLIFRKDIYAMACVMGGFAYWVCGRLGCDPIVTQVSCCVCVFLSRVLAVRFHISLPILKGENND